MHLAREGAPSAGQGGDSWPGAEGKLPASEGPTSPGEVRDLDLTRSYDQSHSPGTLWTVKRGRGAPPSPKERGERRRSEIGSLSQEPSSVGELCGVGEGDNVLVSRGCWENTGREGCSSLGSSSGNRPASGHRHRAALGRGARTLQTRHPKRNEEGKAVPTLLLGPAASLSGRPRLPPTPGSPQSDEGGTASTLGNA